ncbi:phosphatidylglycerol--membrane-oligosaccharide glycerophosphotransferase [Serratia marcescens]|uniref:phosphatidylglycerol--membrane-oligosaccharide glycerophosphotransferase n=1 Tax=Serratia TaxID=613 RepID=UPI0005732BC5|nr:MULTISPECIES: phosphatidylglycerol--membrane-oligosaccharide glycerophosphotransferase [Serratia]ELD1856604.1 phosphatidylglycerol--membrane-oligosaccharide glycerophosphotransferase [Serratia marcescens]ELH4208121.1 phosphatidylglycerol--membrane-oligosaccharide glycerophosphotransferase [Serratia marcescens]ELM0002399.1 phosphatidylglycerol--membrane-oligosaccharide glycerophosphotransferase [Serratia marcescens]KHO42864.1 phosphoglycerol transferase I [Serratia marcescens]MBH3280671.1 ph
MVLAVVSFVLFLASILIYRTRAAANRWWFAILLTLLGSYLVLNVILIASNYFTGDGITDAVIYTVTSSLKGAGISKYVLPFIGLLAALGLIFAVLARSLLRRKAKGSSVAYSIVAVLLALFSVGTTPAFQDISLLVKSQIVGDTADFSTYYKAPKKTVQGKRPNLVYIYAESLERTYFDAELFPGLADELNALRTDSIDFSNTQQLPGTGYTIAGMVASQCGIPLFAPFDGNASSAVSTFYPENVCLGDVLKAAGYSNYFYQGAELAFAGKDTFLKSHGFDHVYGFKELREQVADPSYKNDWGWYDDSVLDVVYGKFVELSKQRQPFSLFTLTVDTHHPDGFISAGCSKKSYAWQNKENRSLSAVACSQQHIAALIDKIKRSPYFSNTVIVVSSDHLAMNNTAYDILTKQKRRNLFFIIDGTRPLAEQRNEKRSTLDNGATVLDVMGGDNYIGLGRSSLSAPSLSTVFLNIEEKINGWKPAVINQWGLPNRISDYSVDTRQRSFSFSGVTYKVPFILRVGDNRIEPMFNVYLSTPLRKQLAGLGAGEKFVWVDKCYEIGRVWAPKLALSTDICVASGTLASPPQIVQASGDRFRGKVSFTAPAADSVADYQNAVARLQVDDAAMKYRADSIEFMLPGLPEQVKAITGVSGVEEWGRWSDANLAPAVDIDYVDPLPKRFDLVLRARAYGNNVGEPISVRVGDEERFVSLGEQDSTVTLRFDNPRGAQKISITPPAPTEPRENASGGFTPKKLGIGLVSLKVEAAAPSS